MSRRAPSRLTLALVALLAVVLTACGQGAQDPASAMAEAFEATFDDSFSYRVSLEADSTTLAEAGGDAGQMVALLASAELHGSVAEGAASVGIDALGSTVFELRALETEEIVYVRLGIQDLLALVGGGADAQQLVGLLGADLDEATRAVMLHAALGGWLQLDGALMEQVEELSGEELLPDEPDELDEDRAEAVEQVLDALGIDSLESFFATYVTVIESRGDDTRVLDVELELREFLRAAAEADAEQSGEPVPADLEADLADLPETIPGVVTLQDGVVRSVRVSFAEPLREGGAEVAGDVDLVIELSDHGRVLPIEAPGDARPLTAEQIEAIAGALGGLGSSFLP